MDNYLFDNPRYLLVAAILIETVVLVIWATRRVRMSWFLVGPILAGLALLADKLVETNREAIVRVTREVVKAAEEENAQAIIDRLSEAFLHKQTLGKMAAMAVIRKNLDSPVIDTNQITRLTVLDSQKDSGRVELVVLTYIDRRSPWAGYSTLIKTVWHFDFVRGEDGSFRIGDIDMIRINDQPGFDVFSSSGMPRDL